MEEIQLLLGESPYFSVLVTLVLGCLLGKLSIKGFSLGCVAGTLLVGILIGQLGGYIEPSSRWIFFGLFLYVIGYQGGYSILRVWQLRKKTILMTSLIISLITISTMCLATWFFNLDLYTSIGMISGSFVHPEVMYMVTDSIEKLPELSETVKLVALNNAYMGYVLTVIFGMVGPVIMMKWLQSAAMKQSDSPFDKATQNELDESHCDRYYPIDTLETVVKRVFEVNPTSTVLGKSIEQLNAPYFDIMFERVNLVDKAKSSSNEIDDAVNHNEPLVAGDIVTITGRHDTLYYFEDDVIGSELPSDTQVDNNEAHFNMLINTHGFVGKSLNDIKTEINQNTYKNLCIIRLVRDQQSIEITPDLIVKQDDILQIMGSASDIQFVKHNFSNNVGRNTESFALFGIGLVAAYLMSLWNLNIGGLYFYLSIGLSSLIAGTFVGWLSNKINPLSQLPRHTITFVRELSLLAFIAITGLYFGPQMINEMNTSGMKIPLIGLGVVLVSQLFSLMIASKMLKFNKPSVAIGKNIESKSDGVGISSRYRLHEQSAMYAIAISYITSSFLMLLVISMVLNFM
ncbi:hypothetical protein BCU84_03270 [Shewanella sp. 10N.286.51.B7]|uniref:aspartate-alanine antiporter-like transporter n=1 Tax=Shewanella sp. 10N.286.51.B7 TaxID=1880836 RepID=UPI000C857E19|nr:hypothetical protein [Shewanella sp. 10N.286.51.B7]PMG70605.1 hypothetical protein BCU84_03270 [Shewanella sp. 10N.286.51.B7]